MRKCAIFIVVASLLAVLGACQEMRESQSPMASEGQSRPRRVQQTAEMPPTDAQALWQYLTVTNPYTKWEQWPGKEGMYPGQSPHGAYLKLYANPVAIQAVRRAEGQSISMPDGAILVKENYGEDRQALMAITPMYRVRGYNPSGGDWFWAKYGPDGKVDVAGKAEGCINCHHAAPGDDWLYTQAE
jgi:hypothetical protein